MKRKPALVPVREQLYEHIKSAILSNAYAPGQIVQIEKLADQFGVSTTPIREALIRLEAAGFLRMIPNKGVKISEISEEDVLHVWEIRRLLEPYAGSLTALLDIEEHIRPLYSRSQSFLNGWFDLELYMQTDIAIHELFYIHLDNAPLKEMIERVQQMSMRMRYFAENSSATSSSVVTEVTTEHVTILDAMLAHDADATATAIEQHLVNGERRTLESIHSNAVVSETSPPS